MSILTSIKLQILKLRHTKFGLLCLSFIFGVTFLLDGYYILYSFREPMVRIQLIYEFAGILIPLFAAVFIAFMVRLEEQTANMYGILAVRHRKSIIMGLLLLSWAVIVLQLLLQTISLVLLGGMERSVVEKILLLCVGMVVFSIFFPIFHLFLQLKFGIGISLLMGVFECMQCVMYSNIQPEGVFRYIPFAWLMEWKACIIAGELGEEVVFWGVSAILLAICLILLLIWFDRWEGKIVEGRN